MCLIFTSKNILLINYLYSYIHVGEDMKQNIELVLNWFYLNWNIILIFHVTTHIVNFLGAPLGNTFILLFAASWRG